MAALRRGACVAAGESGITVLEVLVAMVILAIAGLALSGATLQVLTRHNEAALRSEANIVARTYLEEVKARPVGSLASEDPVRVNELGQADVSGHFIRQLTVVSGPVVKSRLITVSVSYEVGSAGTGTVEVVTLAYENLEE